MKLLSAGALAVLVVLGAGACGRSATPSAGAEGAPPRLVLLISLDTLRKDRVGAIGADGRPLTPRIDALAAKSVVFDQAYAPIPFTLPSHMSMFTGLPPEAHGVTSSGATLHPAVRTLGESFAALGYSTHALVSNHWMEGKFGFARGFESYEAVPFALDFAAEVNRRAFRILDADAGAARPLFLFLHYLDAHSDFEASFGNTLPYYSPPEFRAGLAPDARDRRFCTDDGKCATEFLVRHGGAARDLPPSTLQAVAALYDAGVSYLDSEIGKLLDDLERRGRLEGALVVVTADHGEEFGEHGGLLHAQPFEESIAVPLIFKLPGSAFGGAKRDGLVELVDLMPTLLDFAGAPPPQEIAGRSLRRMIANGGAGRSEAYFLDKLRPGRRALRAGTNKLVVDPAVGECLLFDLALDPGELRGTKCDDAAGAAPLRAQLARLVREAQALGVRRPSAAESPLDEEQQKQLRSIGYVH